MLKIFATVLLVTSTYAGAVSARGGGPAETMPSTNYTDMPSYRPEPLGRRAWIKRKHHCWHWCRHHGAVHDR